MIMSLQEATMLKRLVGHDINSNSNCLLHCQHYSRLQGACKSYGSKRMQEILKIINHGSCPEHVYLKITITIIGKVNDLCTNIIVSNMFPSLTHCRGCPEHVYPMFNKYHKQHSKRIHARLL